MNVQFIIYLIVCSDSWVELNFQRSHQSSISQSPATTPPLLANVTMMHPQIHGQMEKLLLEAQRESRGSSVTSSQHPSNSNNSSRAR